MWLPPLFHYLSWDQVRWILGPQSSVKWARMYMLDTRWYSQWSAYQNCTTNHLPTPLPSPVMTQTMTRIPIIHLENRTIPTASYSEGELICRSMIHEKKALALKINLPTTIISILVLLLSLCRDMWLLRLHHYLSWDQVRRLLRPTISLKSARMYMYDATWYRPWSGDQSFTMIHLVTRLPSPAIGVYNTNTYHTRSN